MNDLRTKRPFKPSKFYQKLQTCAPSRALISALINTSPAWLVKRPLITTGRLPIFTLRSHSCAASAARQRLPRDWRELAIQLSVERRQDHPRNGAPVYPERKLSIRWDPSSDVCLGSAPPSWQAWIVSETALRTSGGTRGSLLAVGNITSLNNFIGALLYPPSVVAFSKADFRGKRLLFALVHQSTTL
jgi:hypothetical protein